MLLLLGRVRLFPEFLTPAAPGRDRRGGLTTSRLDSRDGSFFWFARSSALVGGRPPFRPTSPRRARPPGSTVSTVPCPSTPPGAQMVGNQAVGVKKRVRPSPRLEGRGSATSSRVEGPWTGLLATYPLVGAGSCPERSNGV